MIFNFSICGDGNVKFQDRDQLMVENQRLRNHIELQREHISVMQSHINLVRQHTIAFILDQMDTLHIQRDTEV